MIARATASIVMATAIAIAPPDQGGPQQLPGSVSIFVDGPASATAADYLLTVDDVPVPIGSVTRGPQPLSAVVLYDLSASMGRAPRADGRRLVGFARPGDTLRLATFADRILVGTIPVTDRTSSDQAAREVVQPAGASPLWDAIYDSAAGVREGPGLRAVVVFSDGMSTGSDRGSEEVRDLIAPSGVVVCVVGVGDNALRVSQSMEIIGRNDALQALARDSGGDYREIGQTAGDPGFIIRDLLDRLRDRVRLDFTPFLRDGEVHRIMLTRGGRTVAAPARVRFPER